MPFGFFADAALTTPLTELLTTEGARRRVRLELSRQTVDEDDAAAVAALDDYRARLTV